MSTQKYCARCRDELHPPCVALCRRDNKTLLCPTCGAAEGYEDARMKPPYTGKRYWKLPSADQGAKE